MQEISVIKYQLTKAANEAKGKWPENWAAVASKILCAMDENNIHGVRFEIVQNRSSGDWLDVLPRFHE